MGWLLRMNRLVLDSSVLIAAAQPSEPSHDAAHRFVVRLRREAAAKRALAFAPPELWLEVHVVERRLARSRHSTSPGAALAGLEIELVAPAGVGELTTFLEHLTLRMRGKRPFANATDLVYLWAAWSVGATVVTLDEGLLQHHQLVCDVTRPQHLLLDPAIR